jgi:hypothetical protein
MVYPEDKSRGMNIRSVWVEYLWAFFPVWRLFVISKEGPFWKLDLETSSDNPVGVPQLPP